MQGGEKKLLYQTKKQNKNNKIFLTLTQFFQMVIAMGHPIHPHFHHYFHHQACHLLIH